MGWAWRSSESYGDKDESDKKPDADNSGAKEPGTSGREAKSWWDKYEAMDRGGYSTSSSYADDDWRGYQGPTYSDYSYDKSIDDSDERWYRKSSFKYSRYKDYSPSSLFRSAFYSSKSSYFGSGVSSEENEAKNKAIRALRTLSRNANTICDKNAKISYAVQYSSGLDVNGFDATLIDGKAIKTIYVSPDAVVEAKTTEDEDEAVDALTGFVLLRVQIAQEFEAATIKEINSTTLRTLPVKLADILQQKEIPSAANIAASHIDECLAGMLSKGILTRLARRNVVKDWGGFAPYFVRHAKKFTAVREKLETAELSAESIAGKLAYNMIDDENAFEIPPEIDAIVVKHLGAEVPAPEILPTCRQLLVELREFLKKQAGDETPPVGPIEQSLRDSLEQFMQEHVEKTEAQRQEKDLAKNMLEQLAPMMDEQFLCAENEVYDNCAMSSSPSADKIKEELGALYSIDQMVATLKTALKEFENKADILKKAVEAKSAAEITFAKSYTDYEQMQMSGKWSHFRSTRELAEERGLKIDFNPAEYMTTDADKALELVQKEADVLKDIVAQYQKFVKDGVQKIREQIGEEAKEFAKNQEHHRAIAEERIKQLQEKFEMMSEMREKADIDSIPCDAIRDLTETIASSVRSQCQTVSASIAKNLDAIEGCKSVRTLRQAYDALKRLAEKPFNYDLRSDLQYRTSEPCMSEFVRAGVHAHHRVSSVSGADKEKRELQLKLNQDWHEKAIDRFLQQMHAENGAFAAEAVNSANSDLFAQLEKMFKEGKSKEDPGHVPGSAEDISSDELRAKVERLAESVGMDADTLLEMFHKIRNSVPSTLGDAGKEIGNKIKGLLPLFQDINSIDNQLFGEMVAVKTKILGDATKQVNDEARNDPEEEYVAYLSHCSAKPTVHVVQPKVKNHHKLEAQASRTRQRNVIAKIREALNFHNSKRTGEVYGVRSGDLDEGGLYKLGYDCEHIWSQKTVAQIPDVAVGILVDQSGSMSSCDKIYQAREMCIALAEAVKKIPGIHLHIYGHTANTRGAADLTLFQHYSSVSDTATASADLSRLGTIDAMSNNYDGYAIKETAKLLAKDPAKRKYLFVIADGLPHGDGYAGTEAEKHVTSVCQFVRERLKIATYAFAVGVPGSHRGKFVSQYGKDNVVFLTEVNSCLPQITRFLRNSIQKEKTLVEIGS